MLDDESTLFVFSTEAECSEFVRAQAINLYIRDQVDMSASGRIQAGLPRDAIQEMRECMPAVRLDHGLVASFTCAPRVFVCEVQVHGGPYPSALVGGISRIVRISRKAASMLWAGRPPNRLHMLWSR